ncbi:MAG TPA: glycosyltransferase family 87 protein [Polyangia bacterium]|jgi:hypothetical protein
MDSEPPRWEGRWRPDSLRRIAYIVFLFTAAALTTHWIQQSIHHYLPKDWAQAHEYDGLEDWMIARLYLQGKNPYTPASLAELKRFVIGHPPTTAFWYIPMGFFEKPVAAELMDLSTWLLLLLHLYLCARELKFPAPIALTALVFGWMFTTDGMTMHWHAIQISEQIAFPLTVCWLYLRREREIPAGIALGVAATFKLFPGILMLLLLFARRYRAFVASVAVYLSIAAFMTATYGLSAWPMFLKLQQPITRNWLGSIRNASLQGIILRLTSPICVGSVVPNRLASIISAVIGLALLAAAAWLARPAVKASANGRPQQIDLPYALFTVLAVFLNPWIWEHYYVLMIQPAFVLVDNLLRVLRDSWRRWLDEDEKTPERVLLRDGAAFLSVTAALLAIAVILKMDVYEKINLEAIWRGRQTPWYHFHLHLTETLNWLPWVLLLGACYFAVWYQSPGRFNRD